MGLIPKNAVTVTYACIVLHNLLIQRREGNYLRQVARQHRPNAPNLEWQVAETLAGLEQMRGNNNNDGSKDVREHLRAYFMSESGKCEWQERAIANNVRKLFDSVGNVISYRVLPVALIHVKLIRSERM